jgi:transposase
MKRKARNKKRLQEHLEQVNLYAAGIDIGSTSHFVAVPSSLDDRPVREYSCFTGDLEHMADWLKDVGITTIAMESTGVYWIPAYELLDERGFEVCLVNPRHLKNVPGRKTDVLDCQWLQQLHSFGLLRGSFRPSGEICVFRAYMRQRSMLVESAATHIQHMQKALRQMNLLLDNVVSDITGKTGMTIIRSILSGQRDPVILARYRNHNCKNSKEIIAQSLKGHYKEEHLFSLRQAVELYDFYQRQIADCNQAIAMALDKIEGPDDLDELPPQKSKARRKNKSLPFDVRQNLHNITGVDITKIDGVKETTALKIISEIGTDMSAWPTVKNFASWLGLSPGNKITGGKVISSKTKTCANRAAEAFRIAAYSLTKSKSALGAYYRRKRSQLGPPKAITATAHKIARLVYSLLKYGTKYVDPGQDYYEKQYRDRIIKNLHKKAKSLGYEMVPQS